MKTFSCTRATVRNRALICVLMMTLLFALVQTLQAASTTATVSANIVITISLATRNGIVFGDISASSSAGSIILGPEGSIVSTGGANVNSAVPGTPANLEVTGLPGATYSVSVPATVILQDEANNTMTVNDFSSIPANTGLLDSGGYQSLQVGGTLHVGSFQAFGSYSGNMPISVNYN